MAEGPGPVSNTLLQLEQKVTCGICHDRYQEPKLLPCCHYYCKQCILSLSSRYQPNQPFPCPGCREPTLLPSNDPNKLPTAFFINRMKELHTRMGKAYGKLEALCEMCSCEKAIAYCCQCIGFICEECVDSHQLMKTFDDHVVFTLEELKQGGVKELTGVNTTPQKCPNHDEPQKIFCFDCKQLICRDCVIFDHRDHRSEFVKKAAPETRNKLARQLLPLKNLLPDLGTAVNQVGGTKQEIEAKGELLQKQVNAKFQELHDILEQCKAHILRECSDVIVRKMEKLTTQEKDLSSSVRCVQGLVDFIEHTLQNVGDDEVLAVEEQVMSRVDMTVKRTACIDPVENADFGVEVLDPEYLKRVCESDVVVYERAVDSLDCTVKGDGARTAEMNKLAKFTLFCVNNSHQQRRLIIEVTLKSLVNSTSLQLDAVPLKKGVYSIEYIPKVRGQHHLLISVDGQPIAGSPFSVLVSKPPAKLDKPVIKIGGIDPYYLAINSSNEMIVTDSCNRDVVIMNTQGQRLRNISKSQYGFQKVWCVAVDKDDNIYVCDAGNHCVYKFSRSGERLKRFGRKGSGLGEFIIPQGVVVVDDQVFVCDRDNNRVQVLTTELEPVKEFGSYGTGNGRLYGPVGIASDDEGMLYVSDYGNHRIQVFSREGQFVCLFGKKGSGQGELNGPRGVCVNAKFVFVTEYYNSRVSVFTKEGQFVTFFGEGHITSPYGVFVDSDSLIYVCSDKCLAVF